MAKSKAYPHDNKPKKPSIGDEVGTKEHTGHRANIPVTRPVDMSTIGDPAKVSDGKLMRPVMVRESDKGRR